MATLSFDVGAGVEEEDFLIIFQKNGMYRILIRTAHNYMVRHITHSIVLIRSLSR